MKYFFIPIFFVFSAVFFYDSGLAKEANHPVRFEKGHYVIGAEIGYGLDHNFPHAPNSSDLRFSHIAASFQLDLTGRIGQSYTQGSLNWYAEINADFLHNPGFGTLVGLSPLMFQYKFVNSERKWVPTLLGGAGISLTDWDNNSLAGSKIGGSFQFLLHSGVGIEYLHSESGSFSFNYRFLHVSNAGMRRPNLGVNASLFTLGFTF